jgi:hypothetical protein
MPCLWLRCHAFSVSKAIDLHLHESFYLYHIHTHKFALFGKKVTDLVMRMHVLFTVEYLNHCVLRTFFTPLRCVAST